MKKLILLNAFISLVSFANAQTSVYHPFPDTNSVWSDDDDNIISNDYYHQKYGLKGDTSIGGKAYKKICSLCSWDTNMTSSYNTYYAAIREENKRIYTVIGNNPEQVLYDFNLTVGDTMFFYYSQIESESDTFSRVVSAIDSIQLYTGQYRKRYTMANGINCYLPDVVVEGIGSISNVGLFNPFNNAICTCGDEYTFTCFKELDTVIYLNKLFCNYCFCGLSVNVDNIKTQENIIIYPNPATDKLQIDLNSEVSGGNSYLKIYDVVGNLILEKNVVDNKTNLNVSSFPCGVYIVEVKTEKGIEVRKFVKE